MLLKKKFSFELLSLFVATLFVGLYAVTAFSQDAIVTAPADFFSQVLQVVQNWGGISTMLKIASVITLIVASMKVSYLNQLIWSKLGAAQVYVAPVLGLIGGCLSLGVGGPVTAASMFAYVSAGAGAVFLHEILDSIKSIPGLGSIYLTVIGLLEGALGGGAAKAPPVN